MPSVNTADRVIADFPELLIPHFQSSDNNKHGVEHHIVTTGPPLHACACRLDAAVADLGWVLWVPWNPSLRVWLIII